MTRTPSRNTRPATPVRLQKLLAGAGVASRRAAEGLLRAGRVAVNGVTATLGQSADPAVDVVTLDGKPLEREAFSYWLLNKPARVVTTVRDPEGRESVLDLLPEAARRVRLYPVGRLDRDTEGLLLLTNDGALAQVLLHPSHESEREYRVTVRGSIDTASLKRLAAGIHLEDGRTAPARVGAARHDTRSDTSEFELVLIEGRKRQIRRACQALGYPVARLVRVRMGPLRLGSLARGAARPVTAAERRALLQLRDAGGVTSRESQASGSRRPQASWRAR